MSKYTPEGEPEPCHRCGEFKDDVVKRLVVTSFPAALSGSTPKATGYISWGCDDCWVEFNEMRRRHG